MLPFELPPYPGLSSVPHLDVRGSSWAAELVRYHALFWEQIAAVTERDVGLDDFRVPLDLVRGPVQSVQWFPLLLTGKAVQRNESLVELLGMFSVVRDHSRFPMPLLVDLDVWYRLVKLSFGVQTQRWDVAGLLRTMPPLYGVWHPYKYTLTLVYRQFHSFFCFLKNGEVPSDFRCSAVVDIRAVELFIAALLVIPQADRRALVAAIRRCNGAMESKARQVAALENDIRKEQSALTRAQREFERRLRVADERIRRNRPLHQEVERDSQVSGARLLRLQQRHELVVKELVSLRDRKNHLVALRLLVEEYAPGCLLLGYLVRDCHWKHRELGTGGAAKKVLLASLLMQLGLCERPRQVEYVRTLCIALLNWREWNDSVPGHAYAEESNEASLSRLGTQCASHPRHLEVPQVMDLFLAFVHPAAVGERELRSHRPTALFVEQVRRHLRELVREEAPRRITYVPFKRVDARLLLAEAEWPERPFLPRPLHDAPTREDLKALFRYEVRVLVRQEPVSAHVASALDAHVPLRPVAELNRRRMELAALSSEEHEQ